MKLTAVFDTNIIMDYARGVAQANDTLRKCPCRVICTLTYMEMIISIPESRAQKMKDFLNMNFDINPLDKDAIDQACFLQTHYRLGMADAIVYGFAISHSLPLITRNTKDFNPRWSGIIVPYTI